MFNKVMLSAVCLAVAVTGPIAYYSVSDFVRRDKTTTTAPAAQGAASPAATPAPGKASPGQPQAAAGLAAATPPVSLEGLPVRSLDEVFQFGVTPEWIMRRWPRVSTGLAQLQLQGYRVPLVTGTAETDLAGSLTYYFNSQQRLEQIAFRGSTGDARNLVGLLSSRYHLTRRLTNDPSLALYEAARSDGQPSSAMRIQAAAIIKANQPHERFEVQLVLQRPEE